MSANSLDHRSRVGRCSTERDASSIGGPAALASSSLIPFVATRQGYGTNEVGFFYLPPELRRNIYLYLIQSIHVYVSERSITVYRDRMDDGDDDDDFLLDHRTTSISSTRWIFTSKQMLKEVRSLIYSQMHLHYECRWNFVKAVTMRTVCESLTNGPSAHQELVLFPTSINVFADVRKLELDLTTGSDFNDFVTSAEAARVTELLLINIQHNLPSLTELSLIINDRSRLSDKADYIFVPHAWFLERLIAIRQLRSFFMIPGGRWGRPRIDRTCQRLDCVRACEHVFASHFAAERGSGRIDYDNLTQQALRAEVIRRMISYLSSTDLNEAVVYELERRL